MRRLFLGEWWHWAIMIVLFVLMWIAGELKMHVIHFNLFVLLLLIAILLVVVAIVSGTVRGQQVTRDPFEDDQA